MITQQTVFVLGAGASVPFGFPTGAELFQLVIDQLQSGHAGFNELQTISNFDGTSINRFRNALFFSGQSSVDAFLERRPEFINIGKAAMAMVLVTREQESELWNTHRDGNWLRYLFGQMTPPVFESFNENKVSFLTFNYDRSLEHFLFYSLRNSYGKTDNECVNQLKAIRIIHLHGNLGNLPWQSAKHSRVFHPGLNRHILDICIDRMKIVHEDIDPSRDKEFKQARSLLSEASRVYFLGFGFGSRNVERLELQNLQANKMRGTALGLTGKEVEEIEQSLGNKIDLRPIGCLDFFRQFAALN